MSRHHYETNPHFIRFQPQDQQRGGPSIPWTSPPHSEHPHHHGSDPDPDPRPRVQIKSRERQRRASPAEESRQPRGPPPARPLPLSPEEPLPPRHSPSSARPLLLSPEEQRPPPGHGPPPPQHPSAKPSPWRAAETAPPPRQPHHHGSGLRIPPPEKTNAVTWSAAVCCAIFWVILILGGLIVLIVYLVYRPRSPYFDIATANLNAAYLDMGFLLNADLTVFANFTNPSKKSSVDFSYVTFELYYYNTHIATQYIEPFKVPKGMSMFANVHLVSSQVRLEPLQSQELQKQIESGPVLLNLKGTFHAHANLGSLLRYSYWLHTHCSISLNGPPSGTMRARRCNTKR
ncbi:PREDICTED: proline-rich receptor-like protein kinase PERK13 [Tarenaya hassleriana]|uniref:proline-rich receptor-like protein kinase PERK13 n=1 Tax=Tarenaya hassleriana TaxID=28532 RepID=UPI00053C103C|nr:PREDICTED: proline-rich receptor-like protein kinase PERK13 [Tarenaya hassleriana]